jgi:putative pyruvate formate lyase activating enzyme
MRHLPEMLSESQLPWHTRSDLVAIRANRARVHLAECQLCEHRCGVNRLAGEVGVCRAGPEARLFRHRVEWSEELELTPSHIFYLSGCDLRCAFCIAEADAFDPLRGVTLTSSHFENAVRWGKALGANNVQWLGGEANIHLPHILDLLAGCSEPVRVVWKSNFHMTLDVLQLLCGVVDVYVADFKFGNDRCASELAGVQNYLSIVTRNLGIAADQADLIVRHLVMPGHLDCCFEPVVKWIREHMPDVKFSVRDGYLPAWRARHFPHLGRVLKRDEIERARHLAHAAGLNCIE